MADEWALRDIGRAETIVKLGTINYSNVEDQFNYQEFSLESLSTSQGSNETKMYPAEKWTTHFESYAPVWESVQEMGCYKLQINPDPDAPKQTLIYGYLGPGSTSPDITAADDNYCPSPFSYISAEGDTTPSQTFSPSTDGGQSFAPPVMDGSGGVEGMEYVAASALTKDIPFIPSSIEHLAEDAVEYHAIIREHGIPLHNIWDLSEQYKSNQNDGLKYLRSKGPIWSGSVYAGANAEQAGQPGAYRVKVNANKGHLILYRVAPMNQDIGYDSRFPWVFPFTEPENGKVRHNLFNQATGEGGLFNNESRIAKGKINSPNIGFSINIDLSAEGPRGAFSGSGGGVSPIVNIMWGWSNQAEMFYPGSEGNFASSFSVSFANNKMPVLRYHDGTRIVSVPLEENPINFLETTKLSLTVEYLSTAILVRTAGGHKLISGQTGSSDQSMKGVWTDNPNISMYVAGCVATFDFMPVYYNPWYPAADVRFGADPNDIEVVDDSHTATNFNFNPDKPLTGFAKLMISSAFNTYANPSSAKDVLGNRVYPTVLDAFDAQTYHPRDMKEAAINKSGSGGMYKPESGWPQCILDVRNTYGCSISGGNPVLSPVAKIYSIGSGVDADVSNNPFGGSQVTPSTSPKDPMSSLSILWRMNTTHTTPLIFGFKTKDMPESDFPSNTLKDISDYVSNWSIDWNSELDYKILRAKGSITLLNPPGYIIDMVSKNRMYIEISDTGYRKYGQAVNKSIKPYIYREGTIFRGITIGSKLSFGPGGDVYFTIECVDGLKLLEDYRMETNLRFDGVSFYMAIALLMQSSDYSSLFKTQDFINQNGDLGKGWKQFWRGGPTIHNNAAGLGGATSRPITWDTMLSGLHYYSSMFFGYQPLAGRSHEVGAGTQLFDALTEIIKNMHNPAALPLFYFSPAEGCFILQIRDGKDNSLTTARRPKLKSEIESEEELKSYLPLLSMGNQPAYEMVSNTADLTSHFTVTGADRATGLPIKATAINPLWKSLTNKDLLHGDDDYIRNPTTNQILGVDDHNQQVSTIYGHLGYKRRSYHPAGNFVADMYGAFSYAMSRLWWLMRPEISINNLTVYGIIDYLDDSLMSVNLTGLPYEKCLLKQSNISYDADAGTVISKCSVMIFPPWQSM